MVRKTALRGVKLMGRYAKIQQYPICFHDALSCKQALHIKKIAADGRERFSKAGKPQGSRFNRRAVAVDPIEPAAFRQPFQNSFGMAAAAERSIHKCAAALWRKQADDCVPQDRNVMEPAHMPSPAR